MPVTKVVTIYAFTMCLVYTYLMYYDNYVITTLSSYTAIIVLWICSLEFCAILVKKDMVSLLH